MPSNKKFLKSVAETEAYQKELGHPLWAERPHLLTARTRGAGDPAASHSAAAEDAREIVYLSLVPLVFLPPPGWLIVLQFLLFMTGSPTVNFLQVEFSTDATHHRCEKKKLLSVPELYLSGLRWSLSPLVLWNIWFGLLEKEPQGQ